MTEPLFYNGNIQVRNKTTIQYRRSTEKGVCLISHLLQEHEAFSSLEEFNMKYGLNTDFLTHNVRVQAVNKYIKGLNIDVQSNNSLNMIKFEK